MKDAPSRTYTLVTRLLLAAVAIAMAAASWTVFRTAEATEAALAHGQSALRIEDPDQRARLLEAALREFPNGPSLAWHGGAQEALSWTYAALNEVSPGRGFAERSIAAAQNGVARAPMQPAPWVRLAAMDAQGLGNQVCDAPVCLRNSWLAMPLARYDVYCARLQLANALGLVNGAEDEQIALLARVRLERPRFLACVSFLNEQQRFQALMLRAEAAAEREQRELAVGRSPSPFFD